jgi:hypothetical protein
MAAQDGAWLMGRAHRSGNPGPARINRAARRHAHSVVAALPGQGRCIVAKPSERQAARP